MQIEILPQTSYGCIYKITNQLNNKCNIGQTTNIYKRFINYKCLNCKRQPKLYNALKKYGWDNFNKEIIAEATTKCQLDELEIYYIKFYDSINNGYNCSPGGSFGKHSLESKAKMSLAHKGKHLSEKTKKKLSDSQRGINKSPKTRQLMSYSQKGRGKGRHLSEETKMKISISRRNLYASKNKMLLIDYHKSVVQSTQILLI